MLCRCSLSSLSLSLSLSLSREREREFFSQIFFHQEFGICRLHRRHPMNVFELGLIVAAICLVSPSSSSRLLYNVSDSVDGVHVAFLGNSVLYYNDCPCLMQTISSNISEQDSVLRGGADLKTLISRGNGEHFESSAEYEYCFGIGQPTVAALFNSSNWDYVVLNDRMKDAISSSHRVRIEKTLAEVYAPMLIKSGATPILLATYAPPHLLSLSSLSLGEYTAKVYDGCAAYAATLSSLLDSDRQPRIAKVGKAFEYVYKDNPTLWQKLFHTDSYHPSPHGTYLQACVLHCTMFLSPPPLALPTNISSLWDHARFMQSTDSEAATIPDNMPSYDEALYLFHVASRIAC